MSRLNKVIAIKLAEQPEHLVGRSDLGSNLPRLTTWVGQVLLSPDLYRNGEMEKYMVKAEIKRERKIYRNNIKPKV